MMGFEPIVSDLLFNLVQLFFPQTTGTRSSESNWRHTAIWAGNVNSAWPLLANLHLDLSLMRDRDKKRPQVNVTLGEVAEVKTVEILASRIERTRFALHCIERRI